MVNDVLCDGAAVKTESWVKKNLGLIVGPAGYRLHPNPKLGACRKVKWEKIENLPPKWRFSPKIDGLL